MKRLIVCCDGTWNRLDATAPTNVVKIATNVAYQDAKGTEQIVFYDEGVGTERGPLTTLASLGGGAFGWGLDNNVEEAFRFLSFNYQPGDEIYIFGFSRGAFTARSLCGLIRKCGLLRREHVNQSRKALNIYRNAAAPDSENATTFRAQYSFGNVGAEDHLLQMYEDLELRGVNATFDDLWEAAKLSLLADPNAIRITYVGIWDTVGSMGVPNSVWGSSLLNRKYRFHDTDLTCLVDAARHATALDETRNTFGLVPWKNLQYLNRFRGPLKIVGREQLRYRQCWFPGDHGSVGGGTPATERLALIALEWVLQGATLMGLAFKRRFAEGWARSDVASLPLPSPNRPQRTLRERLLALPGLEPRPWLDNGTVADVSDSAVLRWKDGPNYRPKTLDRIAAEMDTAYGLRGLPTKHEPDV